MFNKTLLRRYQITVEFVDGKTCIFNRAETSIANVATYLESQPDYFKKFRGPNKPYKDFVVRKIEDTRVVDGDTLFMSATGETTIDG